MANQSRQGICIRDDDVHDGLPVHSWSRSAV
jgi:hypothetical protein